MAFAGGIFSRLYNFVTDRNNGVHIMAQKVDDEFAGIATALSNCILKDGSQTLTADIPWSGRKLTGLGAATAGDHALNRDAADARYPQLSTTSGANTLRGNPTGASATLTDITLAGSLSFNAGALGVAFGTTATTAAVGNDSRIVGAAQKAANLSDLPDLVAAKTTLGLQNVSNTSDVNKPVSTAQQTALDAKLPKDGSQAMTGALTLVTGSVAKGASTTAAFGLQTSTKTRNVYFDNTSIGFQNEAGSAFTFSVDNSGNTTQPGTATWSSDERLKSDIVPIEGALATILALTGYEFTMNGGRQYGLIAQEVLGEAPHLVIENDRGYLALAYAHMAGHFVQAIKELHARIAELEARA